MKFSISWLKEYLDTEANVEEIVDTLNKIGLEVDEVLDPAEKLKSFNCVYVEKCEKHPDSDHLHVCKVITKDNKEPLTIVCGAPNVHAGMKAILAPAGSILPDGTKIEKTKKRGVESNGMLCSEKELGIGEDHNGIYEANSSTELGANIADILNINDPIIAIDITPNRGDCLGIYGIARDLAGAGLGKLKDYSNFKLNIKNSFKSLIDLTVTDENCPIFFFREIKNLNNCESPLWLKNRLKIFDINPKNALIDISNYVMLCFNKPLHCYDKSKIEGHLNIRESMEGEEFYDLFDRKYNLPKGATLICDNKKSLCLGGIIGAKTSCSSMETNNVLVESAIFDAINTAKTGRKLNLQTDSRYRFERGSDYDTVAFALDYACQLIVEICGGEVSEMIRYEQKDYEKNTIKTIDLDIKYIHKLIGIEIPEKQVLNILENLQYKVKKDGDNLTITVPHYKNNIIVKEDIIDDLVRIYGYDKLNNDNFTDMNVFEKEGNLFTRKYEEKLYQIRQKLATNGLVEIISYSFLDKKDDEMFVEVKDELDLLNPIIADLSHMRQNLLTNMLNIIEKNNNRGFRNLGFFEIGRVFNHCRIDDENKVVVGIRSGLNLEKNIYEKSRNFDIFDAKRDLCDTLNIFGINGEKLPITRETPKYYHPNRSGTMVMGKNILGYFGELHPRVIEHFGLKDRVVAFELFLDKLPKKIFLEEKTRSGFKPNDFQVIERDLSFTVNSNVEVGNIISDIYKIDKNYIQSVGLFDVYQKPETTVKSIAFNIKIQPQNENLEKQQIDNIIEKIIELVEKKYNGILRDK